MTTNTSALDAMIAKNKTTPAPARGGNRANKAQPIGNINIKIAGVNVFNRSIWAESTSDTVFLNQLNDLVQSDKEKAALVIIKLLENAEVEINTKATSDATLEDLLAPTV